MRYLFVATIASVILWTSGCVSKTTSPSETTTSEGQQLQAPAGATAARHGDALVRFVNADPEGKGRDVWAKDVEAFNRVGYKMITPYLAMPTGVKKFHLRESGETKDLTVSQQELFFGRHYTMVALPNRDHSSSMVIMSDNLSELESGRARVRLINATPNLDDVDLYIAGTKTRIQHGVDASKATSFTDVDKGTLEIRMKDGHAPPQFSNLKVEVDRLYTFIVVGTADTPDLVRIEDQIDE